MLKNIFQELSSLELYYNIIVSLKNVFVGFIIAFVVVMVINYILYEHKSLDKLLFPVIELLRPIPNAAWVPIAIIMCRTINLSIIFITFIGAFFPMFINIHRSLENIPISYLNMVKLHKMNKIQKYLKVIIPSILSNIFTSLMLGISGAWLSVIMAEMISGKSGIGYYTWKNYTLLNYEYVFLGIAIMGVLGSVFSLILSLLSKKIVFWERGDD